MVKLKRFSTAIIAVGVLSSPAVANAAPIAAPDIVMPVASKAGELSFTSAKDAESSGEKFWTKESDFSKAANIAADSAKRIIKDRDRRAHEARNRADAIQERMAQHAHIANGSVEKAREAVSDAAGTVRDVSKASQIVSEALAQVGKPYVWGATGPDTFDCSGLVQWAANKAGVQVPRVAIDQAAAGQQIGFEDLRPGDLVSYTGGSHIAIYIGGGKVVHAPQPGDVVKVADVGMSGYYKFTRIA